MKVFLLHPDDSYIERKNDSQGRLMASLHDDEGTAMLIVPGDQWTDAQIMRALALANGFYAAGVKHGERCKSMEIRKVLGIPESAKGNS